MSYGGVKLWLHTFLISALDGGEWPDSSPGRFNPEEGDLITHWLCLFHYIINRSKEQGVEKLKMQCVLWIIKMRASSWVHNSFSGFHCYLR